MKNISRLAIAVVILLSRATCVQAQDEAKDNPLDEVTREMKVASGHLAKKATDKPTQKAQDDAVLKLDQLIVELEERKKRRGTGNGTDPSEPAEQSTIRSGPGGMGDLHATRMQGDRWGDLPAHERDRILQSLTEGFPPHYQAVLEAYYKRLAVEKRAEEPEPTSAPKSTAVSKPTAMPKSDARAGNSKAASATPAKMSTQVKKTDK